MSIVYSVTVNVDLAIAAEWLRWMQNVHIPEVMATGCFTQQRMHRMLDPIHDEDSITFNIQYLAPSREVYETYREQHAPALQARHHERYGERTVAFRTLLEVVE